MTQLIVAFRNVAKELERQRALVVPVFEIRFCNYVISVKMTCYKGELHNSPLVPYI
jgi:hypothetical protein